MLEYIPSILTKLDNIFTQCRYTFGIIFVQVSDKSLFRPFVYLDVSMIVFHSFSAQLCTTTWPQSFPTDFKVSCGLRRDPHRFPFTLSSNVHLDVTRIVFDRFLETLAVRQRGFLAHLDGDLCEGGYDPTFQLRNVRPPRHVCLQLHKPPHEKVTWGEVDRARWPGQIGWNTIGGPDEVHN